MRAEAQSQKMCSGSGQSQGRGRVGVGSLTGGVCGGDQRKVDAVLARVKRLTVCESVVGKGGVRG